MAKLGEKKKIKKAALTSDISQRVEKKKSGTFVNLPVDILKPNPHQPRKVWNEESLQSLSDSIKKNGVLHSLSVFQGENGDYYVAAGERRLRASKMAGLETVPCLITTGNPAEIGLLENLQREDLNPLEEADAYKRMQKEFGYTHQQLAKIVGKSRTSITDTLLLLKLPEEIKEECQRVDISKPKRELIKIARMEDPEEQIKAFRGTPDKKKTAEKKTLTDKEKLEKLLNNIKRDTGKVSKLLTETPELHEFINAFEKLLNSRLGGGHG